MANTATILLGVLGTALTALISWGVERFVLCVNTKIKGEKAAKYLSNALMAVESAVKSTYQTSVEAVKGTNAWNLEAQKSALTAAIVNAQNMLSETVKNYITANYGNLTAWLAVQIEAKIYDLKNSAA